MEKFWEFSVRTYRTPGAADACLALQNDYGADVNMLLYCTWLGAEIGPFDGELFTRASEYSARWAEHVVIPLREARTWMKHTGCGAAPTPTVECMRLREEVKSVEFAAEKMQQEVLESMAPVDQSRKAEPGQVIADAAANLMHYLEGTDIQPAIDVRRKLSVMLHAAFPEIDEQAVAQALET